MLKNIISKVFDDEISLVSSAHEVARAVKGFLVLNDMSSHCEQEADYRFYTSDNVDKFVSLGSVILEKEIKKVEHVNIEKY
jgi:glutamate racemase